MKTIQIRTVNYYYQTNQTHLTKKTNVKIKSYLSLDENVQCNTQELLLQLMRLKFHFDKPLSILSILKRVYLSFLINQMLN